jgi:hypothetical protein
MTLVLESQPNYHERSDCHHHLFQHSDEDSYDAFDPELKGLISLLEVLLSSNRGLDNPVHHQYLNVKIDKFSNLPHLCALSFRSNYHQLFEAKGMVRI